MKTYKSHKTVQAAKITRMIAFEQGDNICLELEGGLLEMVKATDTQFSRADVGGYFVRYADGYTSYSPAKAFEEGYAEIKDSPSTSDQTIEQEIQAKGETAPRVTPADIEANIVSEHYFTADQGAREAAIDWAVQTDRPGRSAIQPTTRAELTLLTFCVLVLKNGFTVTGESAFASPENFDAEIGRKIARENAVAKVWPLMGYELRARLANAAQHPKPDFS